MVKLDQIISSMNSARRLPIVFCLDVSPSMGWEIGNGSSAIELLNAAVANFVNELKKDSRARSAAEIAFVTFSSGVIMDTEFKPLSVLTAPEFKPVEVGGTQMASAVLRSIEKIEEKRESLIDAEIPFFAPFLVLVTDGNPDDNDDPELSKKATAAVKSHCDSHVGATEITVPFIIGVGDGVNEKTLNEYSRGFLDGYFAIKGNAASVKTKFNKVFRMIGNSTTRSIHLNGSTTEIVKMIKQGMHDTLLELADI